MSDELNNKISALKKELEQVPFEGEEARNHINNLIHEIEAAGKDQTENKHFLIDKIKSSIDRFETEHPRATAILNDIMMKLSNMGI